MQTTFSGLCGSDVKQILLNGSRDNPLTALVSFPHVLGHEVVGWRMGTGERVVLNPWLSCVPRGIQSLCDACLTGRYPWCRNFRSGDLPASIHLANCAAAAGAYAERFAAHPSQLFTIPAGVFDEAAVLADPVSVSLRSLLLAPPPGSGAPGSGACGSGASALVAGRCWFTARARSRSRRSRCCGTATRAPRCGRRHAGGLRGRAVQALGVDAVVLQGTACGRVERFGVEEVERWDEAVLALKAARRTGAVKVLLEP